MSKFIDCLEFEKLHQRTADDIYRSIGWNIVIRHDWNTTRGRLMQKVDIDCTVSASFAGPLKLKRQANISEKFRSQEWGDCWVEIWDDLEAEKRSGSNLVSAADYMFYFTPVNTYILDAQALRKLVEYVETDLKSKFIAATEKRMMPYEFDYQGVHLDTQLRSVKTVFSDNKSQFNLGMCVSWGDLQELGILIDVLEKGI